MNTEQPSYYAVIPANVRYDNKISPNAKLLFGEITALCNEQGVCWAQNSYFANLYNVTNVTISRWIKELKSNGYITCETTYLPGTKAIDKRYISISSAPINKNVNRYYQNCYDPINKNVKDNNTSIINKKINKKDFEFEFETFWDKYPNKFNRAQTHKNFIKTAKRDGADAVLRALEIYLAYIQKNNIAKEYIARSTNFVGQKEIYKGYLEMDEQSLCDNVGKKSETTEDLFRRLAVEGGFDDDRDYADDTV